MIALLDEYYPCSCYKSIYRTKTSLSGNVHAKYTGYVTISIPRVDYTSVLIRELFLLLGQT